MEENKDLKKEIIDILLNELVSRKIIKANATKNSYEKTNETEDNYFLHHKYLSTHTFYGSKYKYSTELLQSFGFDIELDNWDKEVK